MLSETLDTGIDRQIARHTHTYTHHMLLCPRTDKITYNDRIQNVQNVVFSRVGDTGRDIAVVCW